jgi:hypothetical protein
VITYRCHEEVIVKGKDITGTFHVAALYIWNGEQWQLSLWQITPWASAGP